MGRKKPIVDEKYIRPKQANEIMKFARGMRRTVYICGATGFGKTSLVADFLSRRRYDYYSAADGLFGEELLTYDYSAERERIVVLDDIQCIYIAKQREYQYEIISELARDRRVWLILISRAPLPAWLKPLHIEQFFVSIGEEELSLSDKEQDAYFANWELKLIPNTERKLKDYAMGYPLFLRIAAMRLSAITDSGEGIEERGHREQSAIMQAELDLFDYLEIHVYDQWEPELQEFLMDISVVDDFDLHMAEIITRKNHVGRLVLQAKETGNFLTERTEGGDSVFEMRRAMKLSMRRRLTARSSKTHIDELYSSAGNGYETQGRFREALAMYEQCHDKEGISRLLISNARQYAGNGNYWEMRRYYLLLPEDMIGQSPELMAGMSLLQSIMMNDEESERWYETLSEYTANQSGAMRRAAQARLLYLDIALPQRGTSNMTDTLKRAWTFVTQRKIILPELSLTNNQPSMMHGGKDFCEWSKRDRELAKTIGKPVEFLLGDFGKGLVNLALAESLLEKGGDSYEVSALAQKGMSTAKIADTMGLSVAGVKYYNRDTYKKLGVTGKAAAVAEARNRRLL